MSLEPSHHEDSNAKARPEGHDEEREERQACAADSNLFTGWSRQFYHPQRASDHLNDVFNESSAATDQDVSFPLEANVKLERRWMLWYDFMKEHSCMEDWLRAAETTASAPNSSHVLYVTAKEELQKYENLRLETRTRLIKLDSLTQRSRTLVGLFRGTMGARVVEMTKDCGQRWDQLSITVNTVCRRLQHFVRQWEDFERQREEMIMWLTDMDLRLTEVEHFSSKDTCSKMHQLQGFQEAVGESAGLLNDLLQQGEELIQRSEPADAQAIEHQLQEVLLHCARVFQGLGRLHTRLLSMRLVFEEDWALCTPDSGCPSESMLEEECSPSEACPFQSSADQLVLEWDPSVDIGGSISHDDTDDSAFSTTAGGNEPPRFPPRRRFKNDTMKSLDRVAPPWTPLPVTRNHQYGRRFKTSTPETATFDPERISAWLGQTSQLRSKAVQTESASRQEEGVEHQEDVLPQWRPNSLSPSVSHPSRSRDLQHHVHRRHQDPQRQQERLCFPESLEDGHITKSRREECRPDDSGVGSWGGASASDAIGLLETRKVGSALLVCLSVLMLAVFIWMLVSPSDAPCHQSNTLARSFSLALRYNAPPPT